MLNLNLMFTAHKSSFPQPINHRFIANLFLFVIIFYHAQRLSSEINIQIENHVNWFMILA